MGPHYETCASQIAGTETDIFGPRCTCRSHTRTKTVAIITDIIHYGDTPSARWFSFYPVITAPFVRYEERVIS